MDIKMNEATLNRPDAKRLINAPAVFVDFKEQIIALRNEPAWKKSDRNAITVFKSGGVTAVLTAMHEGAVLDDIDSAGLVTVQVMEGELGFTGEGEQNISEKQMIVLHPGQQSKLKATKETVVLLTVIRDGEGDIF